MTLLHNLRVLSQGLMARSIREYRKVWGSCFSAVVMPMVLDVYRTRNLSTESPSSGDQSNQFGTAHDAVAMRSETESNKDS
jgi:hypothetical protein